MHTEKVESIIKDYCKKLKKLDKTKSIPYLVKDIDKLIYDMYYELHALRGVTKLAEPVETPKKGHCC